MTREDLERQKFAANYVIDIIDSFNQRIDENQKIIANKRLTHEGAKQFSLEVSKALNSVLLEVGMGKESPAETLEKIVGVIRSISDSIDAATKQGTEELIRMESTQEGMKRALEAVKTTAQGTLLDAEKIVKMAESPPPEDKLPRQAGTRPEKIALKKNAKELREKDSQAGSES
jgi:hypothetical protein